MEHDYISRQLHPHQTSAAVYTSAEAAAASVSIGIDTDASVMLENRSGTHFRVSQCIPMDADAAAATDADAWCGYTVSLSLASKTPS